MSPHLVLDGVIPLLYLLLETLNVCLKGGNDAIPLFHLLLQPLDFILQTLDLILETAHLHTDILLHVLHAQYTCTLSIVSFHPISSVYLSVCKMFISLSTIITHLLCEDADFSPQLGVLLPPLAELPLITILKVKDLSVCILLCLPLELITLSELLPLLITSLGGGGGGEEYMIGARLVSLSNGRRDVSAYVSQSTSKVCPFYSVL